MVGAQRTSSFSRASRVSPKSNARSMRSRRPHTVAKQGKARFMAGYIFSAELVDQLKRNPAHEVLRDLGKAARDANILNTPAFKKLIGYLTDVADGRDRREPQTAVSGTHRPQPRLRVLITEAFKEFGDLTWFRINKIANNARLPLKGQFTRMAASVGRLAEDDLDAMLCALVNDAADKKLLRLLNENGGRIHNCGLELFSRLAYLLRPDLFFLLPLPWADASGCLKYIGDDLRKYCAICRTLRTICDTVNFPQEVRASLFDRAVQMDPMHPTLETAINQSIGGALAWANMLEPGEAYSPAPTKGVEEITMPVEVAGAAIRVRRGTTALRNTLLRMYRECAISGECPKDLLEVAYIAPYPAGDVHSPRNAILLRSDLHTLWDLNLIGVHPESLEIHLHDRLRGTYCEQFAGKTLTAVVAAENARLDAAALRDRWSHFAARQKKRSKRGGESARSGADAASTDSKSTPAIDLESKDVEIQILNEAEPRRSGSSGIWRVPGQTRPVSNAAPGPA